MKSLLMLLLIIRVSPCSGQVNEDLSQLKQLINRNTNAVYMICRGTMSKSSVIAKKFNLVDTSSTHVGLGIVTDGQLTIYNVTDQNANFSGALVLDSLESFMDLPDLCYLAVWKCDVSQEELQKIRQICSSYSLRKICFDATFTLSDNDTLYCSEFCAAVFNKTGSPRFFFRPVSLKLDDPLLELVLGRKYFTYFPVDFFQSNKRFRMFFEMKTDQ